MNSSKVAYRHVARTAQSSCRLSWHLWHRPSASLSGGRVYVVRLLLHLSHHGYRLRC